MLHVSLPVPSLPKIRLPWRKAAAAAGTGQRRLSMVWVAAPVAVVAVAVLAAIALAQRPGAAQAAQQWIATGVAAEYVSSDPSLPAASTVKFPEDYSEPAPTF